MTVERKPLARVESRDERITVRLTPSERAAWKATADAFDEEISRCIRKCADIGRKVREGRRAAQAAEG